MNELIKMVSDRAGIDASQAETAINTVLEHLEGRLPAPIASQLRGALDGGGGDPGDQLKGGLGGMLGR